MKKTILTTLLAAGMTALFLLSTTLPLGYTSAPVSAVEECGCQDTSSSLPFQTSNNPVGLTDADIARLQHQAEEKGWTFTIGHNDATQYPLHTLSGAITPPKEYVQQHTSTLPPPVDPLPDSFDWRNISGVDYTTPIKHQGGCGSCWAFATVGVLECNIKIHDETTVDLSEQWLVNCNSDGWDCGGGYEAHDYHQWKPDCCGGTGAVLEQELPYNGTYWPCGCPYFHRYLIDDWAYINYGGPNVEIDSIKQAILLHGPVTCRVYVAPSFYSYNGGVYNADDWTSYANHMVVLVGWDDNQGTNGVWFLRNSWGPGWGEDGYMRIEYGNHWVGNHATYINYSGWEHTVMNQNIGKRYTDIQSALDDPSTLDGHTLFVAPGTYTEHVHIDKEVQLLGHSRHTTTIDGTGSGPVVHITADNVALDGFTIKNGTTGVLINGSSHSNIINTTIQNHTNDAVRLLHASSIVISNNTIAHNNNGITFGFNAYDNTVAHNMITDHQQSGVVLGYMSTDNTVRDNTIRNTGSQGVLVVSAHNTIHRNTIQDNGIGINIPYTLFTTANDNKICFNNLIDNGQNAYDGFVNLWYNESLQQGNYWSDFPSNPGYPLLYLVLGGNSIDFYPMLTAYPAAHPVINLNLTFDNHFISLQRAINDSRTLDGHVLFVGANTYYEHVYIGKSVHLIGEHKDTTILDGSGTGRVVDIHAPGVSLRNITITHGDTGVRAYRTDQHVFTDLLITGNAEGCYLYLSKQTRLTHSTIEYNDVGVYINSLAFENIIQDNSMSHNTQTGLYLGHRADHTWVFHNTIADNGGDGILLDSHSTGSRISYNTITGNGIGIRIPYQWHGVSKNNFIHHNNILFNTQQAIDESTNFWSQPLVNEGNYWSDYTGVDLNGDGIGDTPYSIPGGDNEDEYPLMDPWTVIPPEVVYVDDEFNISTLGWGYDHFNTVSAGVSAVREDGTVHVLNGSYSDNVIIKKPLLLLGEHKDTSFLSPLVSTKDVVRILADDVTIRGFTLSGAVRPGSEILLQQVDSCVISNNHITKSSSGIQLFGSTHTMVQDNVFSYTTNAINVEDDSSNNTIASNSITHCRNGLYLLHARFNTITANILSLNSYDAVYVEMSDNNTFSDNTISFNGNYGIYSDSSSGNFIYHNNFIENQMNAGNEHWSQNTWNDTYPSGGNYWSDYTGDDHYRGPSQTHPGPDGIGDIPYLIPDGNNLDQYPWMQPWGWTIDPAADSDHNPVY